MLRVDIHLFSLRENKFPQLVDELNAIRGVEAKHIDVGSPLEYAVQAEQLAIVSIVEAGDEGAQLKTDQSVVFVQAIQPTTSIDRRDLIGPEIPDDYPGVEVVRCITAAYKSAGYIAKVTKTEPSDEANL